MINQHTATTSIGMDADSIAKLLAFIDGQYAYIRHMVGFYAEFPEYLPDPKPSASPQPLRSGETVRVDFNSRQRL